MTLCNHVVLCMQDNANRDAFYDNDHPRAVEVHHSAEAPVPLLGYRTLDNGTKKITIIGLYCIMTMILVYI
jgi:hypothetical protein